MAILNYSTGISVDKTCNEIQSILIKHGASKIVFDYENQLPINLTFVCKFKGEMAFFSLPCRFNGVLKVMEAQRVQKSYLTKAQSLRVAWRILKDWILAQMAIVEAQMAELPEVFLQYGVTRNGERLYDYIKSLDVNNSPLQLNQNN